MQTIFIIFTVSYAVCLVLAPILTLKYLKKAKRNFNLTDLILLILFTLVCPQLCALSAIMDLLSLNDKIIFKFNKDDDKNK